MLELFHILAQFVRAERRRREARREKCTRDKCTLPKAGQGLVMMMTMMLLMMIMQMMMVMMAGARDPRGKGWKQDGIWFQEGEERKVGCIKVDNVYVHNIQHLSCSHKHMVVMVM